MSEYRVGARLAHSSVGQALRLSAYIPELCTVLQIRDAQLYDYNKGSTAVWSVNHSGPNASVVVICSAALRFHILPSRFAECGGTSVRTCLTILSHSPSVK